MTLRFAAQMLAKHGVEKASAVARTADRYWARPRQPIATTIAILGPAGLSATIAAAGANATYAIVTAAVVVVGAVTRPLCHLLAYRMLLKCHAAVFKRHGNLKEVEVLRQVSDAFWKRKRQPFTAWSEVPIIDHIRQQKQS